MRNTGLRALIKKIPGAMRLAKRFRVGSPPRSHRRFLLDMVPEHAVGAEIGVHIGDFSAEILRTTSPRELHLIDPWEHQKSDVYKSAWYGGQAKSGQTEMDERFANVGKRFDEQVQAGRVIIHRGFSTDILDQFSDAYFDWIYIDGNHLYDYVKKDLQVSFQKTKPGGLITGDDYAEGGWWDGGVKKAVDELATGEGIELVELRNHQFIFRK